MKIDPREYIVEKLNDNGVFVELDDVIELQYGTSTLYAERTVVEVAIDRIDVTHIVYGLLTVTSGSAEQFRFTRR